MTTTAATLEALAHTLVTTDRGTTHLANSFKVVAVTDGTSFVTWVEFPSGDACQSPPFPNKKLACEWATDHLYLCGG